MKLKLGKIKIMSSYFGDYERIMKKIYKIFCPFYIKYDGFLDVYILIGMSNRFVATNIENNNDIPTYLLVVHDDERKKLEIVKL